MNSRNERNAIKDNMMKVILDNSQAQKVKNAHKEKEDTRIYTHKNNGKVPKYINKYNQQREDDHIRLLVEEERARHPPGTRLMPDEERLETLNDLLESKKEINSALEKLPVVSKTIQMDKHKKSLEEKLIRIEKAIETFSKK